jgi:hypothetical protein
VRAYALKDKPNELVFGVWADDGPAKASGSIIAYVNGGKYELPFTDAVIPDERDASAVPTPIVVQFDAPAAFESAYLGSIEGTPCAIHSPFITKPLTQAGTESIGNGTVYPARDWNAYLAKASSMPPLHAPAPQPEDKPECKRMYADATISDLQIPQHPKLAKTDFSGLIVVRVALDPNGKATALRLDKPDSDKAYDNSALIAATQTKYTSEIYRCKPVSTAYYYEANFASNAAMSQTADPDPVLSRANHNR